MQVRKCNKRDTFSWPTCLKISLDMSFQGSHPTKKAAYTGALSTSGKRQVQNMNVPPFLWFLTCVDAISSSLLWTIPAQQFYKIHETMTGIKSLYLAGIWTHTCQALFCHHKLCAHVFQYNWEMANDSTWLIQQVFEYTRKYGENNVFQWK